MIQIERLPTEAYAAPDNLRYSDSVGLHSLFDRLAFDGDLILVGPKGVGKSLAIAAYAAKHKHPLVTYDCSEDVRRNHLIGSFVLRGNETPFVLGPLPTAIEIANETGHCILTLEEVNSLTPQVQKILNGLTDFRRRIEVPEAGKVFALKPEAKLWVTGSMNTAGYGGTYQLNEDLASRVRLVTVDYPEPAEEKAILKSALTPAAASKVTASLVDRLLTLAKETRQKGALEYALSTRDLVQILSDYPKLGDKLTFQLVLGKYEGETRETMKKRIQSTMGVTL